MRTNRNAASVIFNGHAAIFVNCNIDGSAITGQRLIDRVIYNFVDEMMQGFDIRAAHIHARALADMLNTFQCLNGTYIIIDSICIFLLSHKILQYPHLPPPFSRKWGVSEWTEGV